MTWNLFLAIVFVVLLFSAGIFLIWLGSWWIVPGIIMAFLGGWFANNVVENATFGDF